jgi:hypothetical protein
MRPRHTRLLVIALLVSCIATFLTAGVATPLVRVRQVPLSTWLSSQTGSLVAFQARESSTPYSPLGNISVIDYAGARERELGLSFGYSATGSVAVRSLPDGTGEVSVNVQFTNALTRVSNSNGDLILGYIFASLPGDPSLVPGLSSGRVQAKYIVPDPESPELNLFTVAFSPGNTLTQLKFNSDGSGPLRSAFGVAEGTPGSCVVAETGIFTTNGGGATADGYPAERVDVSVVGGNAVMVGGSAAQNVNASSQTPGTDDTKGLVMRGSWGQLKSRYRSGTARP